VLPVTVFAGENAPHSSATPDAGRRKGLKEKGKKKGGGSFSLVFSPRLAAQGRGKRRLSFPPCRKGKRLHRRGGEKKKRGTRPFPASLHLREKEVSTIIFFAVEGKYREKKKRQKEKGKTPTSSSFRRERKEPSSGTPSNAKKEKSF